jgi:hypothetical protein
LGVGCLWERLSSAITIEARTPPSSGIELDALNL